MTWKITWTSSTRLHRTEDTEATICGYVFSGRQRNVNGQLVNEHGGKKYCKTCFTLPSHYHDEWLPLTTEARDIVVVDTALITTDVIVDLRRERFRKLCDKFHKHVKAGRLCNANIVPIERRIHSRRHLAALTLLHRLQGPNSDCTLELITVCNEMRIDADPVAISRNATDDDIRDLVCYGVNFIYVGGFEVIKFTLE